MKLKRAHPQMIFRRFFFYLIFALAVLMRRLYDGNLSVDTALIFEISFAGTFLVKSFFDWLFFRFGYNEKFFCIKKGIFIKREINIPVKNISSVDVDKELFLGAMNGVLLRIDTEAGCYKKSDFEFPIFFKDGREISSILSRESKPLYEAGLGECMLSTATLSQARVGLLLIVPILNRIGRLIGVKAEDIVLEGLSAVQRFSLSFLPSAISVTVYILLAGWFVNFVWLTTQYIGLRAEFNSTWVTIKRGIIEKHKTMLKKGSIRAYIIRKPPVMLILRCSRVHALCAGYGKETGEVSLLVPSNRQARQKITLEKLFKQKYSSATELKAKSGAGYSQKIYYFVIFSIITAVMLAVNLLFPENGITDIIYLIMAVLIFVKAVISCTNIKRTGISHELKYACIIKGFSICDIYFPVTLPREIKITHNIFQSISGYCTVKIYLRSEKRRSYRIKCVDYESACEFLSNI